MNEAGLQMIRKIREAEAAAQEGVQKDPWRLRFHLMPPAGWLNDPNGLCQMNGVYHVFFQYSPFDPCGGEKFWGHYTSRNLTDWEYAGVPLAPDEQFDRSGVYSGSCLIKDGIMYLFYTCLLYTSLTICQKRGSSKKVRNHFSPTHGLPRMPFPGE